MASKKVARDIVLSLTFGKKIPITALLFSLLSVPFLIPFRFSFSIPLFPYRNLEMVITWKNFYSCRSLCSES